MFLPCRMSHEANTYFLEGDSVTLKYRVGDHTTNLRRLTTMQLTQRPLRLPALSRFIVQNMETSKRMQNLNLVPTISFNSLAYSLTYGFASPGN